MNQNVLVIGARPVGLTMAVELARYRVPVRIIDKAAARTDKSKAIVLRSRTLELVDQMGCGPSFVGLKATASNIVAGDRGSRRDRSTSLGAGARCNFNRTAPSRMLSRAAACRMMTAEG